MPSAAANISFGFTPGTVAIWVVQIDDSDKGVVKSRIPVDATMSGMAALPTKPHIVLGFDIKGGRVMRIDTQTQHVDVAFEDPSMGPGLSFPVGINGARIRDNSRYFTNSGKGTFSRMPIDHDGNKTGDVEVIATLPNPPARVDNAYDDFTFDHAGNAYVSLHSSSYVKITPEGKQTIFLDGSECSPGLMEPTSAALSLDGKILYLCTAGKTVGTTVYGGQLFQIEL